MEQGENSIVSLQKSAASTKRWFIVHILFPLVPFFIGGIVRYFCSVQFKLNTLNSAEFCLSMGVISIFMFQNLWSYEDPLPNEDKRDEVKTAALVCIILGIFQVVFFSAIELFNTLVNEKCMSDLTRSWELTQYTGFASSTACTVYFVKIQRNFKLKAKF